MIKTYLLLCFFYCFPIHDSIHFLNYSLYIVFNIKATRRAYTACVVMSNNSVNNLQGRTHARAKCDASLIQQQQQQRQHCVGIVPSRHSRADASGGKSAFMKKSP